MVIEANPISSATKKQRTMLSQLLGKDFSHTKMTMQAADDLLERIELAEVAKLSKNINKLDTNGQPFTQAEVTYITGEQGGGKTTTATALVVDAYDKDCVKIFCEEVLKNQVIVKGYDRDTRVAQIIQNGVRKLIKIPTNYKLHSPMVIWCNYHLYGVPFRYIPSFRHLARWLRKGIIHDCWLVIDESYIGLSARGCMSILGKEFANQSQQFRKGQLKVVLITTMSKLNDFVIRLLPTTHMEVDYDKTIRKVNVTILKRGIKGKKKISYSNDYYRRFFNTRERILN